ncbi:unnamed protein product [Clonostachys solani]|uniref:Rhodopsin domain-containing protein n=1 Tax=Clonostachys solani TaxID=160281 RepID=A0A9N9ZFN0_9HYPO|nr:unnamed protein product [Clonostachys solani]
MPSSSSSTLPSTMDLNFMGQPRPDPDQAGMGQTVLIVTWLFVSLCVVAVALRFYVRNRSQGSFKSEDWLMLLALALHLVCQGLLTEACRWGFGKEYANMTLQQYVQVHKYEFVFAPFSYALQIVARVSIAILLIRIFTVGRRWFKWFSIAYMALMTVVCVALLGVYFSQVRPLDAWWDVTIKATYRMSPYIQAYVSLTLQFLVLIYDIIFVFLPVRFVWKLSMALQRKIGLILLLSVSLVTAGVQSAKIGIALEGTLGRILFQEAGRIGAVFYIVSIVEQSIVIIMGCIPALGPITQLEIPIFSSLGSSVTSLFSSVVRRSKNKSQTSLSKDIEMARKLSIPDEPPTLNQNGRLWNKQSMDSQQRILRTDDVMITDSRVSDKSVH